MATTFLEVKNRAVSTLAAGINDAVTSLDVASGEGALFPSSYPFHITIDAEILSCTNRSTDTLTVVRARQGTVAAAHSGGAAVTLNITAQNISDLNSAVNTLETAPPTHASSHQDTGGDEVSVTGLSGLLADDQHVLDSEVTNVAIAKALLTTRGDIIFRNATVPARLAKGTEGYVLTQGADDPAWAAGAGGEGADIGALVHHSVAQTIAHATETTLNFDTEIYDTDTMHDNSTNNERLTATTAGKYLIVASVSWSGNVTSTRQLIIKLNGTTRIGASFSGAELAAASYSQQLVVYFDLAASDYVEIRVRQDSGGNLDILRIASYMPLFMMHKILG